MYKIVGITAVILSAVMMGIVMAKELYERTRSLKEIRQAAINIKSELEYRAPVLEECFKCRGKLFSQAYELIHEKGLLPHEALKCAGKSMQYLNSEDIEIIEVYADNLTNEDVGGQIANINWFIDALGEKIRDSDGEYRTKGKLYRSGGALAGIGLVILLL